MTEDTYRGREQTSNRISFGNAAISTEWYISGVDHSYSGPLLVITAQSQTVEFPISEELYDEITESFEDLSRTPLMGD